MQYSSEQLKEITAIIEKDGKLKDVAKFLNLAVNTIRKDSRDNLDLKMAILNGRRARYYLDYNSIKDKLLKITEVAEKTGQISLVAKYLNTDPSKLNRTARKHPALRLAINKGLEKYKANKRHEKMLAKKEKAELAKSKKILKMKKPKRVLVAKLDTIEDMGEENALARYRRMKEAEKETMSRKELKNMKDFV